MESPLKTDRDLLQHSKSIEKEENGATLLILSLSVMPMWSGIGLGMISGCDVTCLLGVGLLL